jgi:hypothetical protein
MTTYRKNPKQPTSRFLYFNSETWDKLLRHREALQLCIDMAIETLREHGAQNVDLGVVDDDDEDNEDLDAAEDLATAWLEFNAILREGE